MRKAPVLWSTTALVGAVFHQWGGFAEVFGIASWFALVVLWQWGRGAWRD